MLRFLWIFLIAGASIGTVVTLFVILPGPDTPMAQLTPLERERLRNQIRHRDPDRGHSGILIDGAVLPAVAPTISGSRGVRSGLTPEERQALREQVRGVDPNLLSDSSALSESIAVNESYPDGVPNAVIDRSGDAGSSR